MQKNFSQLVEKQDCLFRYRAYKIETVNALEENRLYFSRPSNFNDPYDNLIYVNSERVISEIISNILVGMDSYLEKRKSLEDPAFRIFDFFWHQEKLKKYMLEERIKQIYAAIDTVRGKIVYFVPSEPLARSN